MDDNTLYCMWTQAFKPSRTLFFACIDSRLSSAILATSLWALTACGSKDDKKPAEDPVIPIITVRDPPATYTLTDPECQTRRDRVTLTNARVWGWNGPAVEETQVSLVDTETASSLVNRAVGRTIQGEVLERFCGDRSGLPSSGCADASGRERSWSVTQKGSNLRICQPQGDYPRQSYEGIALASAQYLQRARDRYLEVAQGTKIPPLVTLSVLPEVADYYDQRPGQKPPRFLKRYATHNLAYFPETQLVAVFPETASRAAVAKGFFWESSFVLAHEYGHHIDAIRHSQRYRGAGLRFDPLTHGLIDNQSEAIGLSGPSPRSLFGGAVAEAFADLVAYYSEDASSASVIGITDIGPNRDIGSRQFADGSPKILTEERALAFLRDPQGYDPVATSTRYVDPHSIGAVLAHSADQVFQRLAQVVASLRERGLLPENPSQPMDETDQRYRLTLLWMDELTRSLGNSRPDTERKVLLAILSKSFETAAIKHLASLPLRDEDGEITTTIRRDLCQTTATLLPALPQKPFAAASGECH